MKKVGSNDITYQQFMYIIVGTMIGVGILALPNALAKVSKQDAWISAIIGAWYPLYIVLLAIYISKKFPKDNILSLSKKCFGKFAGSLLNFIFSIQFFIYLTTATSGLINLSRVFIVQFLTVTKLAIVILILALYGTYLGLKVIGRINELVFYLLVLFLFFPLIALKDGSLLNVSPFLGSGINNIIKGSMEASVSYAGVEIILLIYPNITDKSKLKGAALKSVLIVSFIYTYITFLTMYYAGPDTILKPYWSVVILNETIDLPFINSFRFLFMEMWLIILFKTAINHYFSFTYSISNSFLKLNIKRLCFVVYPFTLYAVYKVSNETIRRNITGKVMNYIIIFNLLFVTILAIIVHYKKGE
jgi:spore germination protein (amino acid permease)